MIWLVIAIAVVVWGLTFWALIVRLWDERDAYLRENRYCCEYRANLGQLTDAADKFMRECGWHVDSCAFNTDPDPAWTGMRSEFVQPEDVYRFALLVRQLKREQEGREANEEAKG